MTKAVRGAVQVDDDSRDAIWDAAALLVGRMLEANHLAEGDIVSIVFSMTVDLRSANPAAGLRRRGFADTPLFCVQEADVEGSLPRVIRVLLIYRAGRRRRPVPVYLGGAAALRPDLPSAAAGSGGGAPR
jgi:chorismate mutase